MSCIMMVRKGFEQLKQLASGKRLLAAAGAFAFFAAFFALPLWIALTLCGMPCCHQVAGAAPAMSMDMTACSTDCVIHDDEVARTVAPKVAPAPTANRDVVVTVSDAVPAVSPIAIHAIESGGSVPRSAEMPLHLLNSIFRI